MNDPESCAETKTSRQVSVETCFQFISTVFLVGVVLQAHLVLVKRQVHILGELIYYKQHSGETYILFMSGRTGEFLLCQ